MKVKDKEGVIYTVLEEQKSFYRVGDFHWISKTSCEPYNSIFEWISKKITFFFGDEAERIMDAVAKWVVIHFIIFLLAAFSGVLIAILILK